MLWTHPDDGRGGATRHLGACYGKLADGTIPTYRSGGALHERQFTYDTDGGTWAGPPHDIPDEPPAALVPACQCGWRGNPHPYHPADGRRSDEEARDGQGLDAHAEWHHHATAALSPAVPHDYRQRLTDFAAMLGELADERPRAALTVARQLREIAAHLEPLAVAESLAHGVPWETLAADLGHTRQNIHSRYRRPSRDLTDRIQALTGTTLETLLTEARTRRPGTHPPGRYWPTVLWRITATEEAGRPDEEPPWGPENA
ncbi:hypothetical protein SAMN05428942_7258 [Streptomyces sp. 2112.2]|uniref:hypothetical protein n=1 Tax=Streptomyces sp. 2112.2 TaxID=1881024 RepID=UPI00089C1E3B|nr:hypothetical protein [Streptomyces sp. 2112.2]SEF16381.1 hypothetical protein SAMN05428942_7258 [Streptomyces sp. 2112.2]